MTYPTIIQGGMGVAVSGWPLARAVAATGQLGVVSGTALDTVLVRRLQLGDPGGDLRRAIAAFPIPGVADRVLERYFVPGGKSATTPFALAPKGSVPLEPDHRDLIMIGNFVEVFLAKEGHDGPVGINYLEKIQLPTLPSLFGAMLADVDYVLMGAGIPREIPGILDAFSEGRVASQTLHVEGAPRGEPVTVELDPNELGVDPPRSLRRPRFLAIVASVTLATTLARKASGHVDGFVIERPTAGGHNAPPRGKLQLDENDEPIYGERDVVDLQKVRALGAPFWLAGSCADPATVRETIELGGAGVQIGTAFAMCRESGLAPAVRATLFDQILAETIHVRTDARASPTGFPFKVAALSGTLTEDTVYAERRRVCDLGYLRAAYRKESGDTGFRCSSEVERAYVRKGGASIEDTEGRRCLCNALLANVGLGQYRPSTGQEKVLVTIGENFDLVRRCVAMYGQSYSATDVIRELLAKPGSARPAVDSALESATTSTA